MLAFAQMEAGQPARAEPNMERSLALHPRNANGSHYRAHLYYEVGEHAAGFAYLNDWRRDYGRDGLLHCHIAWHCALWAMAAGDAQTYCVALLNQEKSLEDLQKHLRSPP